jgi:transposase
MDHRHHQAVRQAKGFEVLPRRWVVERTFAWLNQSRHLAKDFEQTIASAAAWLFLASIQMIIRRSQEFENAQNNFKSGSHK